MDLTLLFIVLGFLVVVFLIFKFIKKVVFAIFSVLLLIVLVLAGIGGLVYADFQFLSNQEDFSVKLVYADKESYLTGVEIPFENQEPQAEGIKGLDDVSSLDVDSITDESSEFAVVVQKEFFEELVKGKTFDLNDLVTSGDFAEFDLVLTGEEVLEVLSAQDSEDVLISTLISKIDMPSFLKDTLKPLAKVALTDALSEKNMDAKQTIFSLALAKSFEDEETYVLAIEAFQDSQLEVYPDRFTFSILRSLPVSMVKEYLPSSEVSE